MVAFGFLALQYIIFMSVSAGWADATFWMFAMFLHGVFTLQTIVVLFRIYFFIFGTTLENMTEQEIKIIKSLDNLVIILSLVLLWANAISSLWLLESI